MDRTRRFDPLAWAQAVAAHDSGRCYYYVSSHFYIGPVSHGCGTLRARLCETAILRHPVPRLRGVDGPERTLIGCHPGGAQGGQAQRLATGQASD